MASEEAAGREAEVGGLASMADDEPTALATAFELLSDESRVRILRELYRCGGGPRASEGHDVAGGTEPDDGRLPFSTLKERVGIRDSGQFNYHLARLKGVYVRQTGQGYELTREGRAVARLLLESGSVDTDAS
ncbi:MAG: hypothetical protein ABEJ71_03415 [Halodesulfurarchaeum sp.]